MYNNDANNAPQQQHPNHSDNVDEELHRVQLALKAVFSPQPLLQQQQQQRLSNPQGDNSAANWFEQRSAADRYLTSFQTTSVAWMVCDRLLLLNNNSNDHSNNDTNIYSNNPNEVLMQKQQERFFAAQTLHTKCRADAYQLPQSSLPSLRDSLLNHLTNYSSTSGEVALTNRLAMAISALAVQMAWTTVVTDLLQSVSTATTATAADPSRRVVCMQILKVLPEECISDRLVLRDRNVRYMMRDHLVSSASDAFKFLQSWDGPTGQVYQVFHSWIRHVPVRPHVLVESPLVEATFRAVVDQNTMEVAADVVVEILRQYPSHHPSNQSLVQKMIPLSSQLPFDQALRSDDEDVLRIFCRIITEMGESYMSLILSVHENEASQLVAWVLRCSSINETEIANITLHFWYRLVLDLESTEPYEFRQDLVDRYTPHLLQLIDTCTANLMKYPPDIADIADDRVEDINRDRFYVSETVDDCCSLLGGQVVMHRLGNLLQAEHQRINGNFAEWQGIEACLACIQAINKYIPNNESEVLPFCFDLIPRLPADVPPLRFTASRLIGKYASWLAMHPQLLPPLLPYLAQGLSMPLCAPAAAVAIKELCERSNQQMAMGEPVLQLYNEVTAAAPASGNNGLQLKDELEILEGVCKAGSRQIQDAHSDGSIFLKQVVDPIGGRLTAKVNSPNCDARRNIIPEIDRLTTVVRFLTLPTSPTGSSPIVEVIHATWPLLESASNRFPQDAGLAEKICRLHKHAIRTVGPISYAPLLEPLMEQLVRNFERSRQSAYLYAASICVSEYGRNPTYSNSLFQMINAMATVSFSFLSNLHDLTQHPDVVEELFYLMGRMMSTCPQPLVLSPLLQSLFQCAVVGMKLDHRDANKGTLNFIENALSYGTGLKRRNPQGNLDCQRALEHVVVQEGQAIVNNLAQALMGELPAHNIDKGHGSISGILYQLCELSPSMLSQWISVAVANGPERPRMDFLAALDSSLPRDDFNLSVRAFLDACKNERKFFPIAAV